MRCLVGVLPVVSHLYPIVPFARAIRDAGHDVRVATGASLAEAVASAGLAHVTAGEDWPAAAPEAGRDARAARGLEFALKRRMFTSTMSTMLDDLRGTFTSWRPDVVLIEPFAAGAMLAAEVSEIPHAVMSFLLRPVLYGAGAPGDPDRPSRIADLGFTTYWEMRARLGLDPDPDIVTSSRYLTLDMVPPSMHFVSPAYQHGATTAHAVRPALWGPTPSKTWVPPPSLPRPIVHVTFGTIVGARRALDATIEGLRSLAGSIVIATNLPPETLGPLPPSFIVTRWADHEVLLPMCDAVVHHGGLGSVLACLMRGVPAIALPQFADGPINSMKLAATGAGVMVSPTEQRPSIVRAAVERVLGDDLYRRNAKRLQGEIAAMPDAAHGIRLLEELAATKKPLRRDPFPLETS